MDSRDLIRDGDEDGAVAATYGLGREAYALFQSRRMNECIDVLNQLLLMKKNDQKVLHNLIVAEYYRDGCSDPRKVLEDLNNIKKTCKERARASQELEAHGNYGNIISGSRGSGANHQLSASDSSIAYVDEYDTSITTHNIAVVLFHLHEYANAQSVLQPLYLNIEPIEEPIAVQICLLLVDIALASKNATKALEILLYLEKTFGLGYLNSQGDNSSNIQLHYPHPPLKSHSASNNSTSLDISTSDNNSSSTPRENSLVRTLSDENYENFLSTLDSGDQNLTKPPGFSSSNDVTKPPGFSSSNDVTKPSLDQAVPDLDLKLKLHLYKVRLLVLTRNLKAAKREVKNFMNIAFGRDSSTALLLKSELEYARGNYRKAVRLLMTSSSRTEPGMAGLFNNNLGCIYHQLNKHHAATVLYSKALKSCSQLRSSDKPLKLLTFSQDQSLMIVYNCGLQYLICGKPIIAAQCFQKAGLVYSDKPLLWLRIAECCFLVDTTTRKKDVNVDVRVVGEGKWRQLALEDDNEPAENKDLEEQKNKLSIPFARQCLLNALHLMKASESKLSHSSALPRDTEDDSSSNYKANGETKDSKAVVNLNMIVHSSVSVYEQISRTQNHLVKQAVLADLAYSELTLLNPLKALSASRELLNLPECSRIYMFLGRIYAAEALCHLNRLEEAAEYLSVYIPDGINVDFPYNEKDGEQFHSLDESSSGNFQNLLLRPSEATGAVYVNFAAMLAMQGHLEQAQIFARKALDIIPTNRHAILCAAYVDLLMGKAQEAVGLLKACSSHVRFLPAGLKL